MTYKRFEELPVWQEAIRLADQVHNLPESDVFKGRFSLRDQLERAALSVSNNFAEGFERGTTNELLASSTLLVDLPEKYAPCCAFSSNAPGLAISNPKSQIWNPLPKAVPASCALGLMRGKTPIFKVSAIWTQKSVKISAPRMPPAIFANPSYASLNLATHFTILTTLAALAESQLPINTYGGFPWLSAGILRMIAAWVGSGNCRWWELV
jgi:hypothetical protein